MIKLPLARPVQFIISARGITLTTCITFGWKLQFSNRHLILAHQVSLSNQIIVHSITPSTRPLLTLQSTSIYLKWIGFAKWVHNYIIQKWVLVKLISPHYWAQRNKFPKADFKIWLGI